MQDIIRFESLSRISGLVQGFSMRKSGNMRPNEIGADKALKSFSQEMGIDPLDIIKMEQVHGNNVQWVTQEQNGWKILQTDGLLTTDKNTYLSVLTADCLPIFFYDTKKKFVGVAHAGWRGIYNGILNEIVSQFVSKGSLPEDILVGIGPSIRVCCYSVDKERADLFTGKFKKFKNFLIKKENKEYLDLVSLAQQQLILCGIQQENIEDCGICTFDNSDKFFSFRKEGESSGRFIGIIGRR